MGLKASLKAAMVGDQIPDVGGFNLPKPTPIHFKNQEPFRKAIKEQADAIAIIDADDNVLNHVDIDGKLGKGDLHLSQAAFGDLCHFSGVPVSFAKRLAKLDEPVALDVIEVCIRRSFHRGPPKSLIVDSRNGRIEGIVGKETYSPISNLDVLEAALASSADLHLSNGWIAGPNMRLTVISSDAKEAQLGDVVRFGVSVENSLHGDRALFIRDYSERLSCTNGATATDPEHVEQIIHRGDVHFECQKAVVMSAKRSEFILPLMRRAAVHLMGYEEINLFGAWTKDAKNGGNDTLWGVVKKEAKRAALDEGRTEEEVTLWNFVNGITQSAHDASTLGRRQELEAMGYKSLVKFGAVLMEN